MEKIRISEISLNSDSDDLIDDVWFTSPSASFDGSSVNSIPWAEDVVKQNQDLWERVERMFYGEENLPTNDIKLRNEILEWTNHFPYLRVSGSQMSIYFSNNCVTSNESAFEEILAIHPSPQSSSSSYFDRKISTIDEKQRIIEDKRHRFDNDSMVNGSLVNDIEKCLRITSGPLLSRRAQNNRTAYSTRSIITSNHSDTNFIKQTTSHRNKQGLKSALISVRSGYDIGSQFAQKMYGSIDVDRLHSIPYSARIIKIPSLKCETTDLNAITIHKPKNMIRVKTATLVPISRPLRNSITLPAINIEPKYFDRNSNSNTDQNETISALIYPNTFKKMAHSPQKIAKKRSASE